MTLRPLSGHLDKHIQRQGRNEVNCSAFEQSFVRRYHTQTNSIGHRCGCRWPRSTHGGHANCWKSNSEFPFKLTITTKDTSWSIPVPSVKVWKISYIFGTSLWNLQILCVTAGYIKPIRASPERKNCFKKFSWLSPFICYPAVLCWGGSKYFFSSGKQILADKLCFELFVKKRWLQLVLKFSLVNHCNPDAVTGYYDEDDVDAHSRYHHFSLPNHLLNKEFNKCFYF